MGGAGNAIAIISIINMARDIVFINHSWMCDITRALANLAKEQAQSSRRYGAAKTNATHEQASIEKQATQYRNELGRLKNTSDRLATDISSCNNTLTTLRATDRSKLTPDKQTKLDQDIAELERRVAEMEEQKRRTDEEIKSHEGILPGLEEQALLAQTKIMDLSAQEDAELKEREALEHDLKEKKEVCSMETQIWNDILQNAEKELPTVLKSFAPDFGLRQS